MTSVGTRPARIAALLVLAGLLEPCSPTVLAQTHAALPTVHTGTSLDTDEAVRASLETMNAVLARRDLAGFMALFDDADDIMLIGSDAGEVFTGRAGVAGFLKQLYALPFTFAFDLKVVTIRRRTSTAWAFVDGAMVHTAADGKSTRRPYRFSIVMLKRAGAWRWLLFHGSVPGAE